MYLFVIDTDNWFPLVKYLKSKLSVAVIEYDIDTQPEDIARQILDNEGSLMIMKEGDEYPCFEPDMDLGVISMEVYRTSRNTAYDLSFPITSRLDHILYSMLSYLFKMFHLEVTVELNASTPQLAASLYHAVLDISQSVCGDIELYPMVDMFPADPEEWFHADLEAHNDETKSLLDESFHTKALTFMLDSKSPIKIIVSKLGCDSNIDYKVWNETSIKHDLHKPSTEASLEDAINFLAHIVSPFL